MIDLATIKEYCQIDYDDDDKLLELMRDAAEMEIAASITEYDPGSPTPGEKLAELAIIKDMYDNRGSNVGYRNYSYVIRSLIGHAQYKQ